MSAMVSQITGVSIVCSAVGSAADQRKYQSSASLAFVRGTRRRPVNSPHKRPVTRKMFPFDHVIMSGPHVRSVCFVGFPSQRVSNAENHSLLCQVRMFRPLLKFDLITFYPQAEQVANMNRNGPTSSKVPLHKDSQRESSTQWNCSSSWTTLSTKGEIDIRKIMSDEHVLKQIIRNTSFNSLTLWNTFLNMHTRCIKICTPVL